MSEDLRTDHVKLESPSILTKKNLFCPAIGQRRSQEFSCEPNFGGRGRAPWLRQCNKHMYSNANVHTGVRELGFNVV